MRERGSRLAARAAMQKHGYDPIDELVKIAQDSNTGKDVKRDVANILLPYMYPKLSSVMLDADVQVNETSESQNALMRRILESPELSDAAQRLSLAAADMMLERDLGLPAGGSDMVQ